MLLPQNIEELIGVALVCVGRAAALNAARMLTCSCRSLISLKEQLLSRVAGSMDLHGVTLYPSLFAYKLALF